MKKKYKQYIENLTTQLDELGFKPSANFGEGDVYTWLKPCYEDTFFDITVMEASSTNYPLAVSCIIGISSDYIKDITNSLVVHECYNPKFMLTMQYGELSTPEIVFQLPLHWLLLNEDPPIMRFEWPAMAKDAQHSAKMLIDDLQEYAFPLFNKVDTPAKLIDFLINIDDYPRREGLVKGPESPSQYVYAALYLLKSGRAQEAMEELKTGYKIELANLNRLWANDEYYDETLAQFECIYGKYRAAIQAAL